MTERHPNPRGTRELVFDVEGIRESDGGAIPVVVSSDRVVETAEGPEILVHTPDAVDLSLAPLPIIATHARGQVNVGIVDGLRLAGGELRGLATFGERPEAVGYRTDVVKRIIRSVSVGYDRLRGKIRDDGVLVLNRWRPTHVAMVAEGADPRAGFYREAAAAAVTFEMETEAPQGAAAIVAPQGAGKSADAEKGNFEMSDTQPGAATLPAGNDAAVAERLRIEALDSLQRDYGVPEDTIKGWRSNGVSAPEATRQTLAMFAERTKAASAGGFLGMPKSDLRRYSLTRAIAAIAEGGNWNNAGVELEAHNELLKRLGPPLHGQRAFYVPVDVQQDPNRIMPQHWTAPAAGVPPLRGQRDVSVGASGGQYLVQTSNIGFIELLRNRMVALRMGATQLNGLTGNVSVPKQTAAATGYWLTNETTAITESQQTLGQLALTPKNVGAYTEVSRQLTLQSDPSVESLVMNDLARVVAIAGDAAVISGSGSGGQPTGITNTGSIGSVTGTSIDYAKVLEFQTDVAANNVTPERGGYVTTAAVAALLMQRARFSNTDTPLWVGNVWDGQVGGFPSMSSAQMAAASMLFGDWASVVVASWGVLELDVNPYANFAAGIIGFRAFYTMDVGVRYAGAWSLATSIT